jgi:hypothetical protein
VHEFTVPDNRLQKIVTPFRNGKQDKKHIKAYKSAARQKLLSVITGKKIHLPKKKYAFLYYKQYLCHFFYAFIYINISIDYKEMLTH